MLSALWQSVWAGNPVLGKIEGLVRSLSRWLLTARNAGYCCENLRGRASYFSGLIRRRSGYYEADRTRNSHHTFDSKMRHLIWRLEGLILWKSKTPAGGAPCMSPSRLSLYSTGRSWRLEAWQWRGQRLLREYWFPSAGCWGVNVQVQPWEFPFGRFCSQRNLNSL